MKAKTILKSILIVSGALLIRDLAQSRREDRKVRNGADYWERYYAPDIVQRSKELRQTKRLPSNGVDLHLDIYPHPDPQAPLLIINHGAAGYGRLFVPLALALHDRGYTVIVPDQQGQGFSGGRRGDYTMAECTQNIVAAAQWAAATYEGPLFMFGGSVGGALTYYAAAAGAPIQAIACLNLFDFGDGRDGLLISRFAVLARSALLTRLLTGLTRLSYPIEKLRVPFIWLGRFEKVMDEQDAQFQALWDEDPIPARLVSLRALASNLNTPPAIPFEQNRMPTLVINQKRDRMIDPQTTRGSYERLAGPKEYLEIPFGHWSAQSDFLQAIVTASDRWFRQNIEQSL